MSDVLVFGYAAHGVSNAMRERVAQFARTLGTIAHLEIRVFEAPSYEALARAVVAGKVDFAWLPPLAFIALERRGAATPLVSAMRGGGTAFYSALIVRADSPLLEPEDLAGASAAWVEPYSASGYVVPRVGLAAVGVDPRVAFTEERFWHSHDAVVRAVVGGRADFGATYAGVDADAQITRGGWMDVAGAHDAIRVLVRFGAIPGDVIAARSQLSPLKRATLTRSLLAMSQEPEERLLLNDAFRIDELGHWVSAGYDALRRLAEDASKRGLLEADAEAAESDKTLPPQGAPSSPAMHDENALTVERPGLVDTADEGLGETSEMDAPDREGLARTTNNDDKGVRG